MTNITFDDNLITGNDTIDTQHEELINRIQQFVAACESGDGKVKAIKMLDYFGRISPTSISRPKRNCRKKYPTQSLQSIRKSMMNSRNLSRNCMIF